MLELGLRLAERRPARPRSHARRHELVVERGYDHLDPVVDDHLDAAEDVLLPAGRLSWLGRAPALGRAREPVDELVDPGRAQRPGRGASERLSAGQSHGPTA